jgi:small subunit ribosomal protein S16
VEVVGHYSPVTHPATVKLDHDRIAYWLKQGAQPSQTVARLIEKNPAPVAEPVA